MGKAALTTEQIEELEAIALVNDAIGGPSFILRSWWRGLYAGLVRRGLVIWADPPDGFDKRRFAGTTITESGRRALSNGETG